MMFFSLDIQGNESPAFVFQKGSQIVESSFFFQNDRRKKLLHVCIKN